MLLLVAAADVVELVVEVAAGVSKPGGGGVKLVRFGGEVGLAAVAVGACGVSPSLMESPLISTLVIFESAKMFIG